MQVRRLEGSDGAQLARALFASEKVYGAIAEDGGTPIDRFTMEDVCSNPQAMVLVAEDASGPCAIVEISKCGAAMSQAHVAVPEDARGRRGFGGLSAIRDWYARNSSWVGAVIGLTHSKEADWVARHVIRAHRVGTVPNSFLKDGSLKDQTMWVWGMGG